MNINNVNLISKLLEFKTLSIIGMDKNVGKTTTLNYIIDESKGLKTLGLTSIGRDGEEEDIVTSTHKPRIYIYTGTLIATAKSYLLDSDFTFEVLETTGINTPVGEIVIVRAISDGYVYLAGPSINTQLEYICKRLLYFGANLAIIDGALSRKSFASPKITEATVLCTGASVNRSMETVVKETIKTIDLLSIECEQDEEVLKLARKCFENSSVSIINDKLETFSLETITALDSSREILENIKEDTKYIVFKGVIDTKFIENLLKNCVNYNNIKLIVQDGTKVFISNDTYLKAKKKGLEILAVDKINIIFVTVNPTSPFGYTFDEERFITEIRNRTKLPVKNVVGAYN